MQEKMPKIRKNWKILEAKRSIRMCKKTGNPDIQDEKSEISKKLENPETKERKPNNEKMKKLENPEIKQNKSIRKGEKTGKS